MLQVLWGKRGFQRWLEMIQVYLVRWERLSSMNQKKLREHTSILAY